MPESYYSGVGYPYPVEARMRSSVAGSVAPSTASQSTIRPSHVVNQQGQLAIDYPASQISRASHSPSQAGSYHSLRDVGPSDSCSNVGSVESTSSRASRASNVSRASTVRPEDSLSQVGAPAAPSVKYGRGKDLSGRELALLNAQGHSHAPTEFSQSQSQNQGPGPQLLPYTASTAGSNVSSDSTLVIDMRDPNRRNPHPSNPQGQGNGGRGGGGSAYPSDPPTVVVTEADIARGREMWPGLDRESVKCRMKVVLIRERVQERGRVAFGRR
ncbi:hypothetical protein B0H65DRAFT_509291 [Neurospora tetraspora]|uniref:Uncharacterized protein n=1 Tax=Neurospora tetraspora TaxID=94610 RepID=A0AAE0JGQ4_9PEZI|nr:hypothetical protein B0H65DRAFT_509291 [Neurospora tetraspora]